MSLIKLCYFPFAVAIITGKNNRFPFLDILGSLKNTHKNPQIWKSETSPNKETWLGIRWLGLVSLCQIWDSYGYSLNTLKYPIMGICYFFLCILSRFCLSHLLPSFIKRNQRPTSHTHVLRHGNRFAARVRRRYFSEGEKRRTEMRLLFAGYKEGKSKLTASMRIKTQGCALRRKVCPRATENIIQVAQPGDMLVLVSWFTVKKLECLEFITCKIVAGSVASRPKKNAPLAKRSPCMYMSIKKL